MTKDQELKAIQDSYLNLGKTANQLNEAVVAQEKLHKKVLKDLDKHYPELNIKDAKHTAKSTGYDGKEHHTYEADIPVPEATKHLFKSLKSKVIISHNPGSSYHHAVLNYNYEHPNGSTNGYVVAYHGSDEDSGNYYIKNQATGITKEGILTYQ